MNEKQENICTQCRLKQDLIDALITISLVTRVLAEQIEKEGVKKDECNEGTLPASR